MCEKCTALRDENEELREAIRQLEGQLFNAGWEPPQGLKLTRSEYKVLAALASKPRVTKEALYHALYSFDDGPEPGILNVFISKLRRKLSPMGCEIETIWGLGYGLTDRSREILRGAE